MTGLLQQSRRQYLREDGENHQRGESRVAAGVVLTAER